MALSNSPSVSISWQGTAGWMQKIRHTVLIFCFLCIPHSAIDGGRAPKFDGVRLNFCRNDAALLTLCHLPSVPFHPTNSLLLPSSRILGSSCHRLCQAVRQRALDLRLAACARRTHASESQIPTGPWEHRGTIFRPCFWLD